MIAYDRNTPVLFIIFRRPETTAKVFEQIRKAAPKRLYIAADGPRNEEERIECEAARNVVEFIDWDCNVFRLYQEINLGCDKHCFQAISWFFEHEPEGIVLEDDCLPSYSFFGFCSTLLAKYRNDERIGHISGGNYQFGNKRGDGSYYFSNLTHVWGWASWRKVWQEHQFRENNFELFEKLDYLSYLPSHAPFQYYWETMYLLSNSLSSVGWDFKYAYTNLVNNRLSVIPNVNFISNIGCHVNATHILCNHLFSSISNEEIEEINHPTFVCPDICADLYSQIKEYNLCGDFFCWNSTLFFKSKIERMTRNKSIKMKIPKIIHQIYEDPKGPSFAMCEISKSWKELNSDWEYKFWNKEDIDSFMKENYPELISVYNSFSYDVQRWDAIRYLILYKIGGLYVDMDYECIENISPILYEVECALGMEPKGHSLIRHMPYIIGNAFMASIPGHPFFEELIHAVFYEKDDSYLSTDKSGKIVLDTTGPYMITRVYNKSECQKQITLIPDDLVAPLTRNEVKRLMKNELTECLKNKIENAFAIHYFFGSWLNQIK